jgi:hypothetical protein
MQEGMLLSEALPTGLLTGDTWIHDTIAGSRRRRHRGPQSADPVEEVGAGRPRSRPAAMESREAVPASRVQRIKNINITIKSPTE